MSDSLVVVPTYIRSPRDLQVTLTMLESLRKTQPDVDCLVVDDGSPAIELVDEMGAATSRLQFELYRKDANEGFSKTVNVGLRRALEQGQNAVLVNADIEFIDTRWLERMEIQERQDGTGLASVVGARLLYPTGLIQHAGIFFSLLHRTFGHIYQYAPGDLPEALHARACPVTGALQFIRHECLDTVGIYDDEFTMGFEDVDYCIRAWLSGRQAVYQPEVRAFHHESLFRGVPSPKVADWQNRSWIYFMTKYRTTSFAEFVPSLV